LGILQRTRRGINAGTPVILFALAIFMPAAQILMGAIV
jgi:hypothetical protein